MGFAMGPWGRRPLWVDEGPSASEPTLSVSEADWSAGFSSGSFGVLHPLETILAGAGPGHFQHQPQHQHQRQHRHQHPHQHRRQHSRQAQHQH